MSVSSTFFGGGTKIGAIVAGQYAGDTDYLPCDGLDRLSASYPDLDKTGLQSFGTNDWVSRTLPATQIWIASAFGNGVFVAVALTAGTAAASSTDGITWTARSIPSGAYNAVAYIDALSLFVAVGNGVCATTPDGITWTVRTIPAKNFTDISFGAGLIVATQTTTNTNYATSPDGVTWTLRTTMPAAKNQFVSYINEQFVCTQTDDNAATGYSSYLSLSGDGLTWEQRLAPGAGVWQKPHFHAGKYWFCTGSANPLLNGYWSTNLATFTAALTLPASAIYMGSFAGRLLTSSGKLSIDGFGYPVTSPITIYSAAFGNGALVATRGGSVNTCYSISVDAAKFRTPLALQMSDAERVYIKAK